LSNRKGLNIPQKPCSAGRIRIATAQEVAQLLEGCIIGGESFIDRERALLLPEKKRTGQHAWPV
jgi:hypothetical protein